LAPLGSGVFRSGDLLARFVQDVDSLQDLLLRVVPPFGVALVAGAAPGGGLWRILPPGGHTHPPLPLLPRPRRPAPTAPPPARRAAGRARSGPGAGWHPRWAICWRGPLGWSSTGPTGQRSSACWQPIPS